MDIDSLGTTTRISFGTFEVDLQAGEIWKAGFKVRLPVQPFKVLSMLLAAAGEVVTRQELQSEIWGFGTSIDFERGLAGAINKIRQALNDSAENPKYIETLPKRGYRFIAPVTFVNSVETRSALIATTPAALASAVHEPPLASIEMNPLVGEGESPVMRIDVARLDSALAPPEPYAMPKRMSLSTAELFLAGLVLSLLVALLTTSWLWHRQADAPPLEIRQLTRDGSLSGGPPNAENLLTLATDGDRVITTVVNDGQPELAAIYVSTGEVQKLTVPQDLASSSLADISRDGSKLLLRSHPSSASEQPLWVVPSSGGSALKVGGILAHDAAWMPDGTSILYANENDLAVVRLSDGVSTPFAKLRGRAFWMRWSPDGKLLRFTLMNPIDHTSAIWEVGPNGGQPRQVSTPDPDRLSACCGTWTADGKAYVLQAGTNLWKLTGSSRYATATQLTNGPLRYMSPVTARSGSSIFFIGLNPHSGMQKFDSKSGFSAAPAFMADGVRVEFSRDGAWVAWTDVDGRLWRARTADGSDKLQLTPDYMEAFMAQWSPDGKHLAVMAREHGKVWQTYLIDAAGGIPQPLLSEDRNAADPGWSPDSQSIVFGREPDLMGKETGSRFIEIIHLASKIRETVPGSEGLFSPRWSPDGRWIAALSQNQRTLMLYDVAQRQWKEIAATSAADPHWAADSKSIYVHAFQADQEPILNVSVPDGAVHVVARLSDFHDGSTVNYFFGGLTPAGEPLVEPRIGTGNLYTLDLNR